MKKVYLFAVASGLTLATYHHRSDLFPDLNLRTHFPLPLKQFWDKWFPIQNIPNQDASPTIQSYIQLKNESNKRIVYSHLHKRPLAVHQLITKNKFSQNKKEQVLANNATQSQSQTPLVDKTDKKDVSVAAQNSSPSASSVKPELQTEIPDSKSKTQSLYNNFFNYYAKQLINSQLCTSVELISGPIYSKDTPFKQKKEGQQKRQSLDNVYVSHLKISPNGEYLTDRYYTIVVCHRKEQTKYINSFSMRRSYAYKTFRLTNYLTSLKKLEEQTGLLFNLQGEPLTVIDYKGINKDRPYADFENKQEQK